MLDALVPAEWNQYPVNYSFVHITGVNLSQQLLLSQEDFFMSDTLYQWFSKLKQNHPDLQEFSFVNAFVVYEKKFQNIAISF